MVQVHVPPPGISYLWLYQVVLAGLQRPIVRLRLPDLLSIGAVVVIGDDLIRIRRLLMPG